MLFEYQIAQSLDATSHSRGTTCPSDCADHPQRGCRECRVLSRTRSLVCEWREHTSKSTTGKAEASTFPTRMVLTAYIVRAPVRPAFVSPSLAGSSDPRA